MITALCVLCTGWLATQSPPRVVEEGRVEHGAPQVLRLRWPSVRMDELTQKLPPGGNVLLAVTPEPPALSAFAASIKRSMMRALRKRGFTVVTMPTADATAATIKAAAAGEDKPVVVWMVVSASNRVAGQVDIRARLVDQSGATQDLVGWDDVALTTERAMFTPLLSPEKLQRDAANLGAQRYLLVAEFYDVHSRSGDLLSHNLSIARKESGVTIPIQKLCRWMKGKDHAPTRDLCKTTGDGVSWTGTTLPKDAVALLILMEAYNRQMVETLGGDVADLPVEHFPSESAPRDG